MSGRSYDKKTSKSRRNPLSPSERQLRSNGGGVEELKNDEGLTGLRTSIETEFALELRTAVISDADKKRILEEGKQTQNYAFLRALEVIREVRAGIKPVDDLNNTKGKSLKDAIESLGKISDHEEAVLWDKEGRYFGRAVGNERRVGTLALSGVATNGTHLHNHPWSASRPLGASFSLHGGDIDTFARSGQRHMIVVTREGIYEAKATKQVKFKRGELLRYETAMRGQMSAFQKAYQESGKPQGDGYHKALWGIVHQANAELARKKGYEYKFTPFKGFEGIYDVSRINEPLPPL